MLYLLVCIRVAPRNFIFPGTYTVCFHKYYISCIVYKLLAKKWYFLDSIQAASRNFVLPGYYTRGFQKSYTSCIVYELFPELLYFLMSCFQKLHTSGMLYKLFTEILYFLDSIRAFSEIVYTQVVYEGFHKTDNTLVIIWGSFRNRI